MYEGAKTEKLDRWLIRHGMPDALSRWRNADATKAPNLAFMAVAGDPRLLMRLNRDVAEDLARQAEQIAQDFDAAPETMELTRTAAQVVASRVKTWRAHVESVAKRRNWKPPPTEDGREKPDNRPRTDQEVLAMALTCHPYYREVIAERLSELILRLGVTGLLRLGAPMDAVMALGAARFAAQSIPLGSDGTLVANRRCTDIIQIVQEWSGLSGMNPFLFDLEGGATALAKEEAALLRDVSVCATVAASSGGGTGSADYDMWETAEEFHAYAVLSLRSRAFDTMDYDEAQRLVSAGARLAEACLADSSLRIPVFPAEVDVHEPKSVLSAASGLLRRGATPRRSAVIGKRARS